LNKKLVYLFAVLVAGLFVMSACEQAIGAKIKNNPNYNYNQLNKEPLTIGDMYFPKNTITTITEDTITPYEAYAKAEIDNFLKNNNVPNGMILIRESTQGKLVPSKIIIGDPNNDKILRAITPCTVIHIPYGRGINHHVGDWSLRHQQSNKTD